MWSIRDERLHPMFRRRGFLAYLEAFALLTMISRSLCEANPADSSSATELGDGVTHRFIGDSRGPWKIHVLEVDLRKGRVTVESGRVALPGAHRSRTTELAAGGAGDSGSVIGATNGDFFKEWGEPISPQVQNGRVVAGRRDSGIVLDDRMAIRRAQFGMTFEGHPFIGSVGFEGCYGVRRERLGPIESVNGRGDRHGVHVWTGPSGSTAAQTASASPGAIRLRSVRTVGDTMFCLTEKRLSSFVDSGWALLLHNIPRSDSLRIAGTKDTVFVVLSVLGVPGPVGCLVGGLPRLLDHGEIVSFDTGAGGLSAHFAFQRHPRTGVGFSGDSSRLFLVTVDGRQAASAGMTLREFAALLRDLGAANALNLDGGGSTTMVVGGRVVNLPSDATGERPVANALVVLRKQRQQP